MKLSLLICTAKRPDYLLDLLCALKDAGAGSELLHEIVIVDNDREGSAKPVVERAAAESATAIRYVHEPVANISRARNRALAEAQQPLCLFLDDDQLVAPDFFSTLAQTIADAPRGFAAIRLAIRWQFETNVPDWLRDGLSGDDSVAPERHLKFLLRTEMGTGGLLIDKDLLSAFGPEFFDPELGASGGEDVDFFLRTTAKKMQFLYACNPAVRERVPAARATVHYCLKSARRKGFVDARLATRKQEAASVLAYAAKSIATLIIAALTLPFSILRGNKSVFTAGMRLARQWGKLTAFLNPQLAHYGSGSRPVVMHLTGGGQDGGAEKIIEQISIHTAEENSDLCFFFYDSAGPRPFSKIVSNRWPNVAHHKKAPGIDLLLWLRLIRFAKKHQVSVIHTHDIGAMLHGFVARLAMPRLKLIHTEHTLHYWIGSKKYRMLYRNLTKGFSGIACVSGYVRQQLKLRVGVPEHKLKIVPNGVDTEAFRFPRRDATDPGKQGLKLVSVSRIDELKNIGQILRGIAVVRARGLDVTLTHVGTGNPQDVELLRTQIAQLNLNEVVTLAGYQTQVAKFLEAADCFISASLVECHPVSVLEAMASGKPCILSPIEPHKELLQDGIILFGDDDESVADALIKINEQINSYPQFAYKLIKAAQTSYSIPVMLTRYHALYAGI